MSEFAPSSRELRDVDAERIHSVRLAHLAALVIEASMRGDDLVAVAQSHVDRTGVAYPNSYAPNKLRVGEQVVPENDNSVYRQVTERAIDDLIESGVVRGAKTALGEGKTSGDTVYWNRGEDGKGSTLGQGFVIEAPVDAAAGGWVTAEQVQGIYARDDDGKVKNILPDRLNIKH